MCRAQLITLHGKNYYFFYSLGGENIRRVGPNPTYEIPTEHWSGGLPTATDPEPLTPTYINCHRSQVTAVEENKIFVFAFLVERAYPADELPEGGVEGGGGGDHLGEDGGAGEGAPELDPGPGVGHAVQSLRPPLVAVDPQPRHRRRIVHEEPDLLAGRQTA